MEESFVAKIAHRLIKKHIAGNTMNAAIKKGKALNDKGMLASITFLSDAPKDTAKSKYIASTYLQLIREISRFGLKASVHIPIEQLGVNKENALENLKKVVEFGNKYGVFIWLEEGSEGFKLDEAYKMRGVGVACRGSKAAMNIAKKGYAKSIKLICSSKKEELDEEMKRIKELAEKRTLVLLAQNDSIVEKMVKLNNYKKSLIFEFPLGYSEKRLAKLMKRGAKVSIYLPFGRDWISYILNTMPSGYMRSIAAGLLAEKGEKNEKKTKR